MAKKSFKNIINSVMQMRIDPETCLLSRDEIAERLGISTEDVLKAEESPGFWENVYIGIIESQEKRLCMIISGLFKKAESGDVSAVKLVLEMLGFSGKLRSDKDLTDFYAKAENEIKAKINGMTYEEIKQELARIESMEKRSKRKKTTD